MSNAPQTVGVRIDEIRPLKHGWLNGQGKPFLPKHLDWVVDSFANLYPTNAKLPYLFPTVEGNLLAEWSLGQNAVSLEIDLNQRTADWHALNLNTGEEDAKQFDLNTAADWLAVASGIKSLSIEMCETQSLLLDSSL